MIHVYMYFPRGKGDAPDRFWATVEPYCADITEADVSLLLEDVKTVRSREEGVVLQYKRAYSTQALRTCICQGISSTATHSQQTEGEEVYEVPALGRHYSSHWALEDVEEERSEAGRVMENVDTGNRSSTGDWQKESGTQWVICL